MTKKTQLLISLLLSTFASGTSFFILLHSIDKGEVWRIIASSVGFLGFLLLNVLVTIQWMKYKAG